MAPFALSAAKRGLLQISRNFRYATLALAMATLPIRLCSVAFWSGLVSSFSLASSRLSTSVSIRLMKKLATDAIFFRSPPLAASFSSPAM